MSPSMKVPNSCDRAGGRVWKYKGGRVKFMFCKKATKFDEIFTVDLTITTYCQIEGEEFFSIFVAFSENINFNNVVGIICPPGWNRVNRTTKFRISCSPPCPPKSGITDKWRYPLLVCTWLLNIKVWKTKLDELDFLPVLIQPIYFLFWLTLKDPGFLVS